MNWRRNVRNLAVQGKNYRAITSLYCTDRRLNPPYLHATVRPNTLKRLLCVLFLYPLLIIAIVGVRVTRADDQRTNAEPIQLSVMPYLPAQQIEKIFAPIANELSQVLERPIELRSSASFEVFYETAMTGAFPLVYTHPFDFVELHDTLGYNAIARGGDELSGIVVTVADSALSSLEQLRGSILTLPPKRSAVSRLMLFHLIAKGINPETDLEIQYVLSHHACMHQVVIGEAAACGTAPAPLRMFETKMKKTLRELSRTPSIPPALFAAHPSIDEAHVHVLRKVFAGWENSPRGKKLLESMGFDRLVPTVNQDYDRVRALAKQVKPSNFSGHSKK